MRPETRAAPRPLLAGEGLALRSAAGGLALVASGAPLAEGPGGRPEYAPPCLHNVGSGGAAPRSSPFRDTASLRLRKHTRAANCDCGFNAPTRNERKVEQKEERTGLMFTLMAPTAWPDSCRHGHWPLRSRVVI